MSPWRSQQQQTAMTETASAAVNHHQQQLSGIMNNSQPSKRRQQTATSIINCYDSTTPTTSGVAADKNQPPQPQPKEAPVETAASSSVEEAVRGAADADGNVKKNDGNNINNVTTTEAAKAVAVGGGGGGYNKQKAQIPPPYPPHPPPGQNYYYYPPPPPHYWGYPPHPPPHHQYQEQAHQNWTSAKTTPPNTTAATISRRSLPMSSQQRGTNSNKKRKIGGGGDSMISQTTTTTTADAISKLPRLSVIRADSLLPMSSPPPPPPVFEKLQKRSDMVHHYRMLWDKVQDLEEKLKNNNIATVNSNSNDFDDGGYEASLSGSGQQQQPQQQQDYACESAPRKKRVEWEVRYNELLEFKNQHGHTGVPKDSNPVLYKWIGTQRTEYKYFQEEGKHSKLTQDKIDKLNALGLVWYTKRDKAGGWDGNFRQLQQYHLENGHCRVQRTENTGLARWVGDQRKFYKRFQAGKKPMCITQERINKLNVLGFSWDAKGAIPWDVRFKQVEDYYNEHGHCKIPYNYPPNPALPQWQRDQRKQYKKFIANEHSRLTEEKINRLNGIKFDWVTSRQN